MVMMLPPPVVVRVSYSSNCPLFPIYVVGERNAVIVNYICIIYLFFGK